MVNKKVDFDDNAKDIIKMLGGWEKLVQLEANQKEFKESVIGTYLFLDDIRTPLAVYELTKQEIFLKKDWQIVRSYDEFVSFVEGKGGFRLPYFISFDHDLSTKAYQGDYESEKTGYDCALYLVNRCLDLNLPLPKYFVHSMNPVGKERIESLFSYFKKVGK